ncbi:GNAT family N-acetyltransferase [Paenibacillus sp. MZ04-78.2]|uniref:GNAT family N-acetyltransferase n=1 Tax=Paenibacillus sp. MZ04-78.2 TaxID=2962034 RepID=UPI0020B69964|nr:GNAT family N-acetyltransferase [Paenibacillus sp. MZ04-78.2]MCP3772905.1 GNAT family N-acetyltransferase [Paenibacillus sp. MZ04-78.2]
MNEPYALESMNTGDGAHLLALARSVGWNFSAAQPDLYLRTGPVVGHRDGEKWISCAGFYAFGQELASIGHLIVDAAHQGQGLGKRLMLHCLSEAEKTGTAVTLVSTKSGFPLYTSLGFRTVEYIHRFQYEFPLESPRQERTSGDVDMVPLSEAVLAEAVELDRTAAGVRRERVLHSIAHHKISGWAVCDSFGAIQGYGFAWAKDDILVVGPLVSADADMALRLLKALIAGWRGRIQLDVPSVQASFRERLRELDFREVSVSPQMLLGTSSLPGRRELLFALADPAFG